MKSKHPQNVLWNINIPKCCIAHLLDMVWQYIRYTKGEMLPGSIYFLCVSKQVCLSHTTPGDAA